MSPAQTASPDWDWPVSRMVQTEEWKAESEHHLEAHYAGSKQSP